MCVILIIGGGALVLTASVVGFTIIQIKSPFGWRLASFTLVLITCCWASWEVSKQMAYFDLQDEHGRRLQICVEGLDQLAGEGHTNDFHRVCQIFFEDFSLSAREDAGSNFNTLTGDTFDLSEPQSTSITNKPETMPLPKMRIGFKAIGHTPGRLELNQQLVQGALANEDCQPPFLLLSIVI